MESDSCNPQLQHVNLPPIVPNIEDHEHTLIYSKDVKAIYSVSYDNTLPVFYNNDHIRKHNRPIVITKNVYKLPLKVMNNDLRVVSLAK